MSIRRLASTALAASLVLALSTPAPAAEPAGAAASPEVQDLKCFSVFGNPPEEADDDVKHGFELITLFFAGKLYGRDPAFSMKDAARRHGLTIELMDAHAEMQRCLDEFNRIGDNMAEAGKD